MVEDEYVRVVGDGEPLVDGSQRAGGIAVVAVEEEQIVAGRVADPRVARTAEADVLRQVGPR